MHTTGVYIAREQFIHHQTVERTQARREDFHTCVVRALLHTHVFMKFKSSCTVSSKGTVGYLLYKAEKLFFCLSICLSASRWQLSHTCID